MEGKTASKQSIARVVMPVVAVAFLLWDHYETQQAIKDTFSFDCQVTVVDAETGEHLNPSFIGWNNAARGRDLFPQSVTTTSRSDGSATLRGITSLPKSFVFSTPGYVSEVLVIKRGFHSSGEVTIKLKRETAAGETGVGKQGKPAGETAPPR